MVNLKGFAFLALTAGLMHAAPALAADYDPPIYASGAADEYVPVEVGSGWYLRGDVGYVFKSDMGDVTFRSYDPATTSYIDGNRFASQDFKQDVTFSGGFGYHFNDFLRADATVDGFRSKFEGTSTSASPCATIAVGTCSTDSKADVSTIALMANGYLDLGTYVGLTPYVGAGAGMAYVRWGDVSDANYCVGAACPGTLITNGTHGSEGDWRFTYAFMAGAAYDLSKNLKLDVGYRYRKVNGGDAYGFDGASATAGATGIQGKDDGWANHEVKVGLRYDLW